MMFLFHITLLPDHVVPSLSLFQFTLKDDVAYDKELSVQFFASECVWHVSLAGLSPRWDTD